MDLWLIIIAVWLAPAVIVGALLLWHVTRHDGGRSQPNVRTRTDRPPAE